MQLQENRSRQPDTRCPQTDEHLDTPLYIFTESMQLIDIWRNYNSLEKQYTHYSHSHDSFYPIDYTLGTPDTLGSVEDAMIHEKVISDHAPIFLDIKDAT